jgi:hypothetical protein
VLSADRRRDLLGSILYNLWVCDSCQQALGFQPLGGAGTSCASNTRGPR